MTRTVSNYVYRLILRSHPPSFIERFGGEMLWIFEEECKRGSTVRLLFDGLLSLLRQRLSTQEKPTHGPMSTVLLISDSRMSTVRLLQGGLIASFLLLGFFSVLEHSGPLPVPFELQEQECIPCSNSHQSPAEVGIPSDILKQPVR